MSAFFKTSPVHGNTKKINFVPKFLRFYFLFFLFFVIFIFSFFLRFFILFSFVKNFTALYDVLCHWNKYNMDKKQNSSILQIGKRLFLVGNETNNDYVEGETLSHFIGIILWSGKASTLCTL